MMQILSRIPQPTCRAVALETTLLVHGVPRENASRLGADLAQIVRNEGANPALVGVHAGVPTVGLSDQELAALLAAKEVPKANTANLGVLMHRMSHAATTVSTTMELAAAAGICLFATGGIGGVHREYQTKLDISSDLAAFSRHPVAVVTSGVKSILDVEATRELLETLGVPVIGYRTSTFPAFYLRNSKAEVDARFDDPEQMASFVRAELARTGRGIVIANPVPHEHEVDAKEWEAWLEQATASAGAESMQGRSATPLLLSKLHEVSGGRTLRSNIELAKSNAALAGRLASLIAEVDAS